MNMNVVIYEQTSSQESIDKSILLLQYMQMSVI